MLLENSLNVTSDALVAIGVTVLIYIIISIARSAKSSFPPGPAGLPVVGYLPFLTEYPHFKFMELAKTYGEVFSIKLGSENVVILNGTSSIREAFSKSEFLGRPPHFGNSIFGINTPVFTSNMHLWQEHRKFIVQSMKDLGLGRTKIESHIQDEIDNFLNIIRESKGNPMNPMRHLMASLSNNVSALVFGKRYECSDTEWKLIDKCLDVLAIAFRQAEPPLFFPWLRYIPFITKVLGYDKIMEHAKKLDDFFRQKLQEHKESLDSRNIRDFIDSYLVETELRKNKDPNTTFSDDGLNGSVSDLYGAGGETVTTSISWCTYIMAAFPDVQRKVQKEIADVVGTERSPEFMDQKQMPYTHAVILEVMRWKTPAPLNVLRYTLADTVVAGYNVPKGTIVMANLWAPHHDPNNWEDPDTFKPERFLAPDGKSVVKSNNFVTFSLGKRACPGEMMAMMETFLYFVSILQKFDIAFPKGQKPTYETELTFTYKLKPHKLCFTSRS